MEYEGGQTASFNMSAFTNRMTRTIHVTVSYTHLIQQYGLLGARGFLFKIILIDLFHKCFAVLSLFQRPEECSFAPIPVAPVCRRRNRKPTAPCLCEHGPHWLSAS